jgi:hypothetical protein
MIFLNGPASPSDSLPRSVPERLQEFLSCASCSSECSREFSHIYSVLTLSSCAASNLSMVCSLNVGWVWMVCVLGASGAFWEDDFNPGADGSIEALSGAGAVCSAGIENLLLKPSLMERLPEGILLFRLVIDFLVSKIWNSCQSETQLTFWDRPATTPTVDMEEGTGGSRLFQPRFLSGTRRREGFQDAHAGVGRQARYTEGSSVVHKCSR